MANDPPMLLEDSAAQAAPLFGWVGMLGFACAADETSRHARAVLAQVFSPGRPFAERAALADALAALPGPCTQQLVNQLTASDEEGRALAVRALAAPWHREAAPVLVATLADARAPSALRAGAAHALAAIGDAGVAEALAAAMGDGCPTVRLAAVVALRALAPGRPSAPVFLAASQDRHEDVRRAALVALLVVGGKEARAAARAALADPVACVRATAVVVLTRHGVGKDRALVAGLENDVDGRVRRAVREALVALHA